MTKIIALLLFIATAVFFLQSAQACEPYPDYWYVETFELANHFIAEPISIHAPQVNPRVYISIQNQQLEPLYILPLEILEQKTFSGESLSNVDIPEYSNRLATRRATPNRSGAEPNPNGVNIQTPSEKIPFTSINSQNSPLFLEVSDLVLLDSQLRDPNPYGFNRPTKNRLQIPDPQYSQLVLYYNEQVITIPFTITYSINPHNPAEDCIGVSSTSQVNQSEIKQNLPSGTLIVILLVISMIMVWLLRKFGFLQR